MAKTQIAEFTIYLRDPVLVAKLQTQLAQGGGPDVGALIALPTGGVGVLRGPAPAGAEFGALAGGAPLPLIDARHAPPTTGAGYIVSQWFADPQYPTDRAVFTLDHTWWWGGETKFYWSGKFALAPALEGTVGTPIPGLPAATVAQRYWLHGFEVPVDGDEGGDTSGFGQSMRRHCLGASRTGDGVGARYIVGQTITRNVETHAGSLRPSRAGTVTSLWERFYVRPLRFGTSTTAFWELQSDLFFAFEIGLTPSGQWAVFYLAKHGAGEPVTLINSFAQAQLGAWTRFDVFTDLAGFTIKVRVNGVLLAQGTGLPGFPPPTYPAHKWERSRLGFGVRTPPDFCDTEMDFDDWVGGAIPTSYSATIPPWSVGFAYSIGNAVSHEGRTYVATAPSTGQAPTPTSAFWALAAEPGDFGRGSHIVRVVPEAFGPAHDPAWVGDVRAFGGRGHEYGEGSSARPRLTTSAASVLADVEVPLATRALNHPQSVGIASWRVMTFVERDNPGTAPGSLGYQVGAGPAVLTPLTGENQNAAYEAMTGQPATGQLLGPGETLRLQYLKGSEAVFGSLADLSVLVELSGVFGPEDGAGTDPAAYPKPVPVHLQPWPRTPWATETLPAAAVIAVGGTYVGNGTGQDLVFPLPVTFLLIRRATDASHDVIRWFPSSLWANKGFSAHLQNQSGLYVDTDDSYVPVPDADQQMQVRVRLATAPSNQVNAAGVTYQYVALLDPAARFTRAFSTSARPVGTTASPGVPRTWPLDDLTFVPEVAYGMNDTQAGGAVVVEHYVKTPAHAAADASDVSTRTLIPGGLTFGSGAVTIGAGLIGDGVEQTAMMLFTRLDGNDAVPRVVFCGSYVGDGAASRTITFGAAGRRPFYAHVGPASAVANHYHRDPSHLGTTSTNPLQAPGISVTTAITGGGIDSFSVGSALNTTGVTYGYFGFYGSTEAGNGGWSTNGTHVLVDTDSRKPPGWVEPTIIPPIVPPGGGGGGGGVDPGGYPIDPGAPGSDIFVECVEASTRIVNLALSEIGITKQITSLGRKDVDPDEPDVLPDWIDTSQEAFAARMVYRTLVDTVLRDDEWAFTREYVTLTAISGSPAVPVNPDWTYAYQLPVDCLRVKRICTPDTRRRYSTTPVPFERRSADAGFVDVLLTNEPGAEVLPEPATGAPRTITIEYAKRILCPARVSDSQFRECLVFRLAAGLAKALSRDAADADRCLRNYNLARPRGLVNQANDQEPQRPTNGNPDWITGR